MNLPSPLIEKIRNSSSLAALTGAGVSQESGLRTFRESADVGGEGEKPLWTQYRPEDLATPEAFERNPNLVWEFYAMRRLKAGEVKPNAGHLALAEMGRRVRNFSLITQNVDGLHQRAGSLDVIELHGNITRARCTRDCGVFTEWVDNQEGVPLCPNCGARLRPDVVWFGEMLPQAELQAAVEAARNCQVFFSIGTASVVHPAASMSLVAKQSGALLVEINPESTPLTPFVDYFLQGKSGEILPELVKRVWTYEP
jgi:NAD-dependent deacetylase